MVVRRRSHVHVSNVGRRSCARRLSLRCWRPRWHQLSGCCRKVSLRLASFFNSHLMRRRCRYDARRNEWTCVAPMGTRRLGVSVSVLNGCLYAVGGSDGQAPLNTVERWSRSSGNAAGHTNRDFTVASSYALSGVYTLIAVKTTNVDCLCRLIDIVWSISPGLNCFWPAGVLKCNSRRRVSLSPEVVSRFAGLNSRVPDWIRGLVSGKSSGRCLQGESTWDRRCSTAICMRLEAEMTHVSWAQLRSTTQSPMSGLPSWRWTTGDPA